MALDIPPPSVDRFRLHPVEPRHASIFCFCASDGFLRARQLCPCLRDAFSAFAVIAAATLPLRLAREMSRRELRCFHIRSQCLATNPQQGPLK